MNNYSSYRRSDIPTEFNFRSQTFVPLRERRALRQRGYGQKKSRKRFYSLITVLSIAALFFFWSGNKSESGEELVSLAKSDSNSFNVQSEVIAANPNPESFGQAVGESAVRYASLEDAVNKALEGSKGDYALVVKHLQTGETYTKQADKQYAPGSLYKLWVMATVFEQIEKGNLTEDQELSRSIAFLNSAFGISSEDAEQTSGTISQTVSEAIHQMITISHNYSAMLLTEKIKLSTVKAFLEEKGFSNSQVGTKGSTPLTTAADIAKFYEQLYNKKLISPEASTKMIEVLKKQQKNNKLPLYLPDVSMAHKTGELGMVSHDAGIVFTEKGDYIIVALSETESPKGAEERIGDVSKAVYEYFVR